MTFDRMNIQRVPYCINKPSFKREIEKSKKSKKKKNYADRVRNLQTIEPRKWHQEIRTMTRNVKSDLCIPVPGIEDSEHGLPSFEPDTKWNFTVSFHTQ